MYSINNTTIIHHPVRARPLVLVDMCAPRKMCRASRKTSNLTRSSHANPLRSTRARARSCSTFRHTHTHDTRRSPGRSFVVVRVFVAAVVVVVFVVVALAVFFHLICNCCLCGSGCCVCVFVRRVQQAGNWQKGHPLAQQQRHHRVVSTARAHLACVRVNRFVRNARDNACARPCTIKTSSLTIACYSFFFVCVKLFFFIIKLAGEMHFCSRTLCVECYE